MPKQAPKPRSGAAQKPLSRSLRIYQKIAIVFVVLSFLLLLIVLYLSVSKATIKITPNPQVVSSNVSIEITANPSGIGQVNGLVTEESFSKAEIFYMPEEGASAVEGKAGGVVTLINSTGSDQPLVATTRLLSEEGVLFRLDEAVTVPAGGEVDAIAHADKEGLAGEVGPTQFTIPGLSASLQEVIYAVSIDSMTGGVEYISVISQDDLDQAATDLEAEILEGAKLKLQEAVDVAVYDGAAYLTEVAEKISDTEPGTEAGSFSISIKMNVTAVFYSSSLVAEAAEKGLYSEVPTGYEFARVNEEGLQVSIQSVDTSSGVATASVYLDGEAVISSVSDVLDKERLIGRSSGEVKTLLESFDAIDEVSVSFTPFWLKRVPTLADHIKIVVEDID
ncbi:MAG: hypothetical protein Q8P30_01910 [Candidatus Uhrbacteria bacterium]|nr:hypothetical protein [Candidatus Uhrbacteria bacterium]